MIKKYLLLIVSVFSLSLYAQDPQLEGIWYLEYIEMGGTVNYTPEGENIFISFDLNEEFFEVNGVNNFLGGSVVFSESEPSLFLDVIGVSLMDCAMENCWFENLYFYEFLMNDWELKSFTYEIINNEDSNSQTLILIDEEGNIGMYGRQNMAVEDLKQLSFNLYPNPTQDKITIGFPTNQELEYRIFDLQGKVLINGLIRSGGSLEISSFVKGIYFLKISNGYKSAVKRIIKN